MESNKLNFQKKTVQRDEWSDDETNFFVQRYNLYENEIGKNKTFRSKKSFFSWIATELGLIGSTKTADQVSSRYYTLTRASKKSKQVTADVFAGGSSVIKMNDLSTVIIKEPSYVYVNEEGSILTNETMAVPYDTPNIHMNESAQLTDTNETSTADMDDIAVIINEPSFVYLNEEGPILANETLTVDTPVPTIVDVSKTSDVASTADRADGYETSNIKINESAIVTGTKKHVNAEKAAVDDSAFNRNRNGSFLRFNEPFRVQNASNIGVATVYSISSRNEMASNDTSDDTPLSRNVLATSTGSSSILRIAEGTTLARSSTIAGTSCADFASQNVIHQSSSSSQSCCVISSSQASISSTSPSRVTLSSKATTLSKRNSTVNVLDEWTDEETKWLLDQYYYYMDDVGPLKTFRTKKDMWQRLATVMTTIFDLNRTGDQLSKRVQTIIATKKNAVDRNRQSGATRVNVEYEEEINRIAAMDDSIEPEVLRDASSVYYKKNSKKIGQSQSKKPRWDRPNKKNILNTLSESILSIETRRTEREKFKEERRAKLHEETMELISSMRTREN